MKLAKGDMESIAITSVYYSMKPAPMARKNKYHSTLGMAGIPRQFMIDKEGIFRYKLVGFDPRLSDKQKTENAVKLINELKNAF